MGRDEPVNRYSVGKAALARIFERLHQDHTDRADPRCRLCHPELAEARSNDG